MRFFNVLAKGVVVVPNRDPLDGSVARRDTQAIVAAGREPADHLPRARRAAQAGVVEIAVLAPPDAAEEIAACIASEGPAGIEVHHLINDRRGESQDRCSPSRSSSATLPASCIAPTACWDSRWRSFTNRFHEESADALLLVQEDARESKRLALVPSACPPPTEARASRRRAARGRRRRVPARPGRAAATGEPERAAPTLDFAPDRDDSRATAARVRTRAVQKWRHFAGDALDLLDMNRTVLDELDSEIAPTTADGNHFEGHIAIHPTASVTLERDHRAGDHRRRTR